MAKEPTESSAAPKASTQERGSESPTPPTPKESLARLRTLKTELDQRLEQAAKAGNQVSREEIQAIRASQQELTQGLADLHEVAAERDNARQAKALQERLAKLRETAKETGPEYLGIPNLEGQYTANQEMLARTKLLEVLASGELGIRAIDGKEYQMPTVEQVKERLEAYKEVVEQKAEQGFKKVLVVPFGLPLERLKEAYGHTIKEHKAAGTLKEADGSDLDLDQDTPVWVWDQYNQADLPTTDKAKQIVYNPKAFDKNNHQGHTKAEILAADPSQAFQILLLEETPHIPRKGQATEVGGRTQLETDQTPREYLETLGKAGTNYAHETGLTLEAWLTHASLHLERTNQVLDDYQAQVPDPKDPTKTIPIASATYLTGAYLPAAGRVPDAGWDRDGRRAYLDRGAPGGRGGVIGVRPAVRVP